MLKQIICVEVKSEEFNPSVDFSLMRQTLYSTSSSTLMYVTCKKIRQLNITLIFQQFFFIINGDRSDDNPLKIIRTPSIRNEKSEI
jgi:hypothetical protein